MCVYKYIRIHTCVCIYMCVFIHTYIQLPAANPATVPVLYDKGIRMVN